jgi:hypothetical protein
MASVDTERSVTAWRAGDASGPNAQRISKRLPAATNRVRKVERLGAHRRLTGIKSSNPKRAGRGGNSRESGTQRSWNQTRTPSEGRAASARCGQYAMPGWRSLRMGYEAMAKVAAIESDLR